MLITLYTNAYEKDDISYALSVLTTTMVILLLHTTVPNEIIRLKTYWYKNPCVCVPLASATKRSRN